ncbi:MAG: carboxypeptidase-like regulatory domain-containing protein, partial [Bacteroidota bacterium]
MNRFFLLLLCLLISSRLLAQTGILSGYVKDKQTQMPISAASIQVEGANLGAISDENGLFSIKDLPTKTYNIKVTCIGYEAQVIYNIVIASGNSEVLTIELESNSKNLAEVLIKKNPFRKNAETPLSIQSLSA